ncbi:MAG TPA: Hsp20/alpha crystallin family protein [Syntrophales bacterium]|nr:Hsp20/alpha crystallin family protein [Syntrophales bacterium]
MASEAKDMTKQEVQHPVETERTRVRKVYVPQVDIYETKDSIVLVVDMPGVDEKSVDITLEKNVLTITGEVPQTDYKGYNISYAEYETGDYQRAFTISDEVDRDKINASVKNGVLKLTLTKAEKAKVKKIAIKAD